MEHEEGKTKAMTAELYVERKLMDVVIDTGAAVTTITDKLVKELRIPIGTASRDKFKIADGSIKAALGNVRVKIGIDDFDEVIEAKVMESTTEELLLGNDFWKKYGKSINFEEQIVEIRNKGRIMEIPVEFIKDSERISDYESSESEQEETSEFESDEGETYNMYFK